MFWVRETWQDTDYIGLSPEEFNYIYKASDNGKAWEENSMKWNWKPSIFMPKNACRIFLKVTNLRVEKIKSISENDAIKEGVFIDTFTSCPINSFERLWKSIHGQSSWDNNPWVWVYDFEIIDKPVFFNKKLTINGKH